MTIHDEIREAKRFALTHSAPSEADVLRSVLRVLSLHPKVAKAWRANSGSGKLQRPGGGASQWIQFGFKGQPDVIGYLTSGKFLAVECKALGGTLSPEQADFLMDAQKSGCVAFVARGVSDVLSALEAA